MDADINMLKEGERFDSLSFGDLKIIQQENAFRFGTDAVLLADFAVTRNGDYVADMGTGTGVIAILMASRQKYARFVGMEIQADMADMASRSVAVNGMQDQIEIRCCDFRNVADEIGYERFSLAVCNPPYGKSGGALVNKDDALRIARHETECASVDDVAKAAFSLLKTGGRFCVIFPAPRAFEMMSAMKAHRLEPKRIRTIHQTSDRPPKFLLIEAVKFGGSMLHWMSPLILANPDGTPSDEWKRIYRV